MPFVSAELSSTNSYWYEYTFCSYSTRAKSQLFRYPLQVFPRTSIQFKTRFSKGNPLAILVQEFYSTVRDKCWDKCITKPSSSLSSSEQQCLARCSDRYAEVRIEIYAQIPQFCFLVTTFKKSLQPECVVVMMISNITGIAWGDT